MHIVSPSRPDLGHATHARMVILTMPAGHTPAVVCGSHVLQRMHVMPVERTAASAMLAEPTTPPARLLPELPGAATDAGKLASSRTVQGEILCDEAGRFYEKIGHVVRPLHHLVAGPRGTLIDVAHEADPGRSP